ncbi:hypothetical protein A2164_01365 [Candidatus Curtissbacteria bacterium RBG_13_35_7]|uniref:LytR/CpsA/Psr regulator C-terminal domain-containing protein n=1 Tax=Candidatus Curtissbacteria bacterium RBG_13_35_7 TaxID=1797705 RepID=A0A1F5G4Q5_9BACT|nr:MAG: hypothetical protein A2164_01365 [Candidatus Curtissbacteria bacterium RBG_13_35_7]
MKLFWIVLPVILIIGALIGGVFIYRAGTIKTETVQEEQSPIPAPTENAQISPAPELKRADLKLQIQNGRGVVGVAAEAQQFLEGLGYTDIEIGNAGSYNYEKTEISIKKDKKNYFDLLREDLSKKYLPLEKAEILDIESEFDAIVIIGKE